MRLGLLQYDIGDDPTIALGKVEGRIREQQDPCVDLWVLPEMCLTGFTESISGMVTPDDGSDLRRLQGVCADSHTQIAGSFCVHENGNYYNRLLVLGSQGVLTQYDKRKLFTLWNEQDTFTAGTQATVESFRDVKMAFQVCFDLRFPELFREVVGAHCYVVVANWPASRREHWLTLLRARAIENQAYVVGVNRIGKALGIEFCGDSVAFDYRGRQLANLEDREDSAYIDIDIPALMRHRRKFPFLPSA